MNCHFQDAIKSKSFLATLNLNKGDVEAGFRSSEHVLEGEIHIGGQEHFYMETNAHIVVPHENGEVEVFR